jgi:hypothetical protein
MLTRRKRLLDVKKENNEEMNYVIRKQQGYYSKFV